MKNSNKTGKSESRLFGTFLNRKDLLLTLLCWMLASISLLAVNQIKRISTFEKTFRYREGDIVREDFVISHDFSFVDSVATNKLIALNRNLVNPVYVLSEDVTASVLKRFDRFSTLYLSILSENVTNAQREQFQTEFPAEANLIDKEKFRDYGEMELLLGKTREILENIQYSGVFQLNSNDGGNASGIVEMISSSDTSNQRIPMIRKEITTPDNLKSRLNTLAELQNLIPERREFIAAIVEYFAEPNVYFSEQITQESIRNAERNTVPVKISVETGDKLLTTGSIVSSRQSRILEALSKSENIDIKDMMRPFLYLTILFALGFAGARYFHITIYRKKFLLLYIGLLSIYLLLAASFNAFMTFVPYINMALLLPTALMVLLVANLFANRYMAILTAGLMALFVYFLMPGDNLNFLVTLVAGIGCIVANRKQDTGMGLLRTGLRLSVIMGLSICVSALLSGLSLQVSTLMAVVGAVNGFVSGILSLAILPLLGLILNAATPLRLMELSDQNTAILKRMRLQAPGTYIHSQNVAQLAEAASDAIGANGLLARVGAYYHDIGKTDQARYFVENQAGENKHDDMKASLSVAVIKSHVKIGIEKGRELHLPDEVLEIIEQHHGTSVIRYFYDRAMKENSAAENIESYFSYGGPKPRSREAAIVMLADSAEAASRVIKKPTVAKLGKCVWDIIMERFQTGELSDSKLALDDLESIKDAFTNVLMGHNHMRIEYPRNGKEPV